MFLVELPDGWELQREHHLSDGWDGGGSQEILVDDPLEVKCLFGDLRIYIYSFIYLSIDLSIYLSIYSFTILYINVVYHNMTQLDIT